MISLKRLRKIKEYYNIITKKVFDFFSSTHQTLILMSLAFLPQQTKQTQLSPQNQLKKKDTNNIITKNRKVKNERCTKRLNSESQDLPSLGLILDLGREVRDRH